MSLALCCIVRNESAYLKEFIAFHVLQGITFFLIYENESTDRTLEVLQDLQKKYLPLRVVINIQKIEGDVKQLAAYNRGIKLLQSIPKELSPPEFCFFGDCDEYLFSPGGANLCDILKNYDSSSQICVHWFLYGSKESPSESGLTIERFQHRASRPNQHCKSIVRVADCISASRNPHHFVVRGTSVDENGNVLEEDFIGLQQGGTADCLRINHYHVRSEEEYRVKMKMRRSDNGSYRNMDSFRAHDTNDVHDSSACYCIEDLKKLMYENA